MRKNGDADGVEKAILVIRAGDATGGAVARRFVREDYIACVTRRSADKLEPLIEQIRADGGEAHVFASDAPTFFVGNEMFFGKDRLRDAEQAMVDQRA